MRNNRLRYDELSDVVRMTRVDGTPLDFLGWSACETAVGNDRAGLGVYRECSSSGRTLRSSEQFEAPFYRASLHVGQSLDVVLAARHDAESS